MGGTSSRKSQHGVYRGPSLDSGGGTKLQRCGVRLVLTEKSKKRQGGQAEGEEERGKTPKIRSVATRGEARLRTLRKQEGTI